MYFSFFFNRFLSFKVLIVFRNTNYYFQQSTCFIQIFFFQCTTVLYSSVNIQIRKPRCSAIFSATEPQTTVNEKKGIVTELSHYLIIIHDGTISIGPQDHRFAVPYHAEVEQLPIKHVYKNYPISQVFRNPPHDATMFDHANFVFSHIIDPFLEYDRWYCGGPPSYDIGSFKRIVKNNRTITSPTVTVVLNTVAYTQVGTCI